MSDKSERHRTLMEAIARLERAINTRPFHTDYGLAKQDGLRDAVSELQMMDLDDKHTPAEGRSSLGRVTFSPHVDRGVAGAKAIAATYDDTLHAVYVQAASRDRRCPECGSREINATEAVCLACSNRAWSDR